MSTFAIGIIGGIGCGKSKISELFHRITKAPVLDADAKSRALTQPGAPLTQKIADYFGDRALLEDGSLNRHKLRNEIFHHTEKRKWLENLLHPAIYAALEHDLKHIDAPYTLVQIPLLYTRQDFPRLDYILFIHAPKEMRIQRVVARDKHDEKMIEAIMDLQPSEAIYFGLADAVFDNSLPIATIERKISTWHERFLTLSQKKSL